MEVRDGPCEERRAKHAWPEQPAPPRLAPCTAPEQQEKSALAPPRRLACGRQAGWHYSCCAAAATRHSHSSPTPPLRFCHVSLDACFSKGALCIFACALLNSSTLSTQRTGCSSSLLLCVSGSPPPTPLLPVPIPPLGILGSVCVAVSIASIFLAPCLRGPGWRIHGGVEDTKLSTKQHSL